MGKKSSVSSIHVNGKGACLPSAQVPEGARGHDLVPAAGKWHGHRGTQHVLPDGLQTDTWIFRICVNYKLV